MPNQSEVLGFGVFFRELTDLFETVSLQNVDMPTMSFVTSNLTNAS